ncbi:MAG: acyltransferase family protein [Paracoccaceae bacterium]|nr:acyltransferase family protein [Paracoccaceae bacterium]
MEEGYRIHSIDSLRAIAMLLGVLLHALTLYLEPIDGSGLRLWAGALLTWITIWRMPLFMILSGFLVVGALQKRTTASFLSNRLFRIGSPLILLWIFIPKVNENASPMLSAPDVFVWLANGAVSSINLGHLWFLLYLLLFCGITLLLRNSFSKKMLARINVKIDKPIWLLFWIPALTLLSIFSKTGALFLEVPLEISNLFSDLKWASFGYLFIFFIIGMQLHQNQNILRRTQRIPFILLTLIPFSLMPLIILTLGAEKPEAFIFTDSVELIAIHLFASVSTLLLCLGIIGLTQKLLYMHNRLISFFTKLSYPIYFFHHTFIYSVGGALVLAGWNSLLAVIVNCSIAIAFSILLYYVFIKFTPLDWIFNGYRRSWFKIKKESFNRYLNEL